jgi:hypothetical protein
VRWWRRRCERHVEDARQGLGQQRLARAGGAEQQDVRLLQLDVVVVLVALRVDALVVVVHRDRQDLLGAVLADHVLVEDLLDLAGLGMRRRSRESSFSTSSAMMSLHRPMHSSQM